MIKLSFNGTRVVVGIAVVLCVLCIANNYLNVGVFGRFGKQAMTVSFIVLAIALRFFTPTPQEFKEYRDGKRIEHPPGS
jgi:hypothetical protein